jgi:hypothetical protein
MLRLYIYILGRCFCDDSFASLATFAVNPALNFRGADPVQQRLRHHGR